MNIKNQIKMQRKPFHERDYAKGILRIKQAAKRAYNAYYHPYREMHDLKRKQLI